MASYLKDLELEGSLPSIHSTTSFRQSTRKVNFDDDIPHERHATRSKSPTSGLYMHRTDYRSESPLIQPRPPSPGVSNRRQYQEMQDQLSSFRDELTKKDALIQQLVSMESVPKVNVRSQADSIRLESLYLGDRQSLEAARSELAAVQVKNEKLQNKLREFENEVEIRDIKVKELKLLMETGRENESRLQSAVESLRGQVADLEGRAGAFESVAGRSEFTVAALQKESKAAQERIVELETRLRKQLEEREEYQARFESLDRKTKEYFSQFASIVHLETLTGGVATVEEICTKLTDMVQDNAMLKGKLMTLAETLRNSELETKASRETIMRLVSEVGKEQHLHEKYTSDLDMYRSRSRERTRYDSADCRPLRSCMKSPTRYRERSRSRSRERDSERHTRIELEREINTLRERIETYQRTIDSQNRELEMRDARASKLDLELRTVSSSVHSSSAQLSLFTEKLASLLGEVDGSCSKSEEAIYRKIETLIYASRDFKTQKEALSDRVRQLTGELETQYDLHKTAAQRARKSELETSDMFKRLQSAEGELASGDVMRDGFRSDKEMYMRCLQQLAEVMKMDRISVDLGMDMTIDALLSRAQQLVKLEKDALADRSTHIYNLQRKVKSLKEQLESKDLHIDLLRKKITSLEEKLLGRSTIEKERDVDTLRIRKLEKLVEKYKVHLGDAKQENVNLKAQLLGSSEIRVRTLEQRKELEELTIQINELEQLRKKQARKIHELKQEVNVSNSSSQENQVVADNAVQALSSELRTTKTALGSMQNREKQLTDFRTVVARMLGLDINTLAIPDYEIISRLEKLINAHHSHTFTTLSLEEALADMEDGFISGYEEYRNTVGRNESQNIRRSRERVKRKALKMRTRSMSPQRRIDPKVY